MSGHGHGASSATIPYTTQATCAAASRGRPLVRSAPSITHAMNPRCTTSVVSASARYIRHVRSFVMPSRVMEHILSPAISLNPPSNTFTVRLVFALENFLKLCLFDGNYRPIEVGNREREKKDRPDLFQQSGLSEVRKSKTDIHRVSREPIGSPGYELRRRFPRNGCSASLVEGHQTPTGDHRASREQHTSDDRTYECRLRADRVGTREFQPTPTKYVRTNTQGTGTRIRIR